MLYILQICFGILPKDEFSHLWGGGGTRQTAMKPRLSGECRSDWSLVLWDPWDNLSAFCSRYSLGSASGNDNMVFSQQSWWRSPTIPVGEGGGRRIAHSRPR